MLTDQEGGTWYYRVRATTPDGDTPWSNVVSTTVAPGAPALEPIFNPDHSPDYVVSWELVTGTITYTLEEDSSSIFSSPVIRYLGVMTSYQIVDQSPGSWFYRVRAANGGGASNWSNVESTWVERQLFLPLIVNRWPPLPYAPEIEPIADPGADGSYPVVWSETPERLADTYTLQEATNPSFSANLRTVCTTAEQTCTVSDKPAGIYYYRVRGQNEWGAGDWSPTRSATVEPPLGLVNGDFEQGPGIGWIEYSDHGWAIILETGYMPVDPRSGEWAAWLGGEYNDLSLVAQEITVQSGNPYLVFWYWIASADYCGYDFGGVVVNFDTVADVFQLCEATNTGGWVQRAVDLSDYAGQTIVFDIRAETDGSLNSNLFIDDVSFAASPQAAAPEPGQARRVPVLVKAGGMVAHQTNFRSGVGSPRWTLAGHD
jgi:hypothetical protein